MSIFTQSRVRPHTTERHIGQSLLVQSNEQDLGMKFGVMDCSAAQTGSPEGQYPNYVSRF